MGKKVLITGADGFIGSHLTELLVQEGHRVTALAQYNSFNRWGWLDNISCQKEVEILTGDIRDSHFCKQLCKEKELVFHLAALIAIPYSYAAPDSYIDTNIKGTLNICQAALEQGVSRVIHTSTSEVYGTALYVPIDEKHPLQAQSPYSASKIGADALALSFFHSFGLPLTIARPFNCYGPRQSARAVIPTMISQLAKQNSRVALGDLSMTRDFTFVKDTCRGFLALSRSEKVIGETINIGSNFEISMADLFLLIREMMESKIDWVLDEKRLRPEKSEVRRLRCDNRKMYRLTDFKPQTSLREGLQATIAWFLQEQNLALYKTDIYNL